MKNLLSKRSLVFLVVALLAVIALAVSLLVEKKQLIDLYEGSEPEETEAEETEAEPIQPKRKPGRPPKVSEEPETVTIIPAVEKPANVVENETSE